MNNIRIPHEIRQIWKFAIHTVVGIVLFCIVGSAAVLLHLFNEWLEHTGISEYIRTVMHAFEFLVFAVDAVCFVVFIIRQGAIPVRELCLLERGRVLHERQGQEGSKPF